ncbi:MAG: aspartate aminotransferase family protein [Andreesenia angusta]|nr:aspartate aminotransferase family protein [Andreesenia angusta]
MKDLVQDGKEYIMRTYASFPIVMDRGEGMYLWDKEGNKYLDFVSGIAVNLLGYDNEKLKNAVNEQFSKIHHCSNLYLNEPNIKLAEKIVKNTSFDKVFFCNSGAESMEAALKLARKYANKNYGEEKIEIITMKDSFHGRTIGSVTVTGQTKYQEGFGPLLPGVKNAIYNDIDSVKELVNDKTCAIVMELVQGEGGINPGKPEFVEEIRKICDENNIVLIFDEVQTGIGRTGDLFLYQRYEIEPDILCTAKGLAGGIPMGAMMAKSEIAKAFEPGNHASTFGGNPLASVAALVVLEELIDNNLLDNVKKQGDILNKRLNEIKDKFDIVKDVRGFGLMQGIEVEQDKLKPILEKAAEKGLLIISAGTNVIRFIPPLIVNEEEINKAMEILEESLKEIE